MRIDKYLKVSRIIKRRVIAKELCDNNRVYVNEKPVNPAYTLKLNDIIKIVFGKKTIILKVISFQESTKKEMAFTMYEIIEEIYNEDKE